MKETFIRLKRGVHYVYSSIKNKDELNNDTPVLRGCALLLLMYLGVIFGPYLLYVTISFIVRCIN